MSLAKGVKGKNRKLLVFLHRQSKFEEAFNRYLNGEVSAEYVGERAKKLKNIKGK